MAVTFSDLRDEALIIVKDSSSYVEENIDRCLNEALDAVCDVVTVPELKRVGIFTTVVDQAWVSMPTGFNGKLLFVGNDSTSLAIATGGVEQLMEVCPLLDESGPVHTVALEGSTLYYQGIPSEATTYPILYVVFPTPWVDDADVVPDYFPLHLQVRLFVHYAAAQIFNIIEDGIEGDKVNTSAQLLLHEKAVDEFNAFIAKRRRSHARSVWAY